MNFSYNLYTETEDEYHKQKVMEIFRKIYDNGYIIEKEEPQTYCPNCQKFLADRELILTCPSCGKETKGEECDCGYNPTAEDLKNANCQACGHKVVEKMDKNLYIALPKLQSQIEKYYEENKENWRKNSQNETLRNVRRTISLFFMNINLPCMSYSNTNAEFIEPTCFSPHISICAKSSEHQMKNISIACFVN